MKTKIFYRRTLISYSILTIGLIITISGTIYTKNINETKSEREFALVCNEIKTKIISRLYSHAQLLRSGSTFFAASDFVNRDVWKVFYEKSKITKNLPGIQGIGFSEIIKKEQLQKHTQQIRDEGFETYIVHPEGDRDSYTSIVYIEPFSGRNLFAFGYDMYSEPIRRKAMDHARDYDEATLSGKVILVQETDKDQQAGTLMYVPVYKKDMPTNTISQRRAAILGWVYSPYRMADLMRGILGARGLDDKNKIHLQVYDDNRISKQSLLFDSQQKDNAIHSDISNHILTIPIVFNEKKWTLRFSQSVGESSYFSREALIILIAGILLDLLFFWLSFSLINARKAQQIAEQLTSKLKESEKRFSLFMEHLPIIAFIKDNEGKTLFVNKYMDQIFGASDWIGKNMAEIFPNELGIKLLNDDLQVLKTGYLNREESFMLLDKKLHTFETQKFIIPQHEQEQEPFLGVISLDISERKLAEATLKESELRYRNLFDRANEGLILLTMDGIIAEVNQSFAQMHGYTIEEMKNMDIKNIDVLNEDAFNGRDEVMQRIYSGEVVRFEVEHYHKNGHTFFLYDTVSLITINDQQYFLAFHQDITERKMAEAELKSSREQLRNFTAHLQQVREKERLAITLEIHDSLAQYLVALKMDIGMFKKKIVNGNKTIKANEIITALDEFIFQVDKTNKSARMIMNGLRPEQIELLGFIEATEVHLHDFETTHRIHCEFTNELLEFNLPLEQSLALFRILQESLINIHKHSRATLVKVRLTSRTDKLVMEIIDNGVGFDKNNCGRPDSFGLIGMNELIRMQNGSFSITSKHDEGTTVKVELPYKMEKT